PEQAHTYFVQVHAHHRELTRLRLQDQMVTTAMGGVLPEQPDPTRFRCILDVGCGTGGWLVETARTYPTLKRLVGVDASRTMLDVARAQAATQRVSDRVEFHVMDALLLLEFPSGSFDLVNQRFGMSYLRTWDWPKLLGEYQRITRPGGVIRVTEGNIGVRSTSSALTRLFELILEAFCRAGHCFTSKSDGVTCQLVRLLQQHGVQQVQTRTHVIEYRAGTAAGHHLYEDMQYLFRTIVPFLHKWGGIPEGYELFCQQALSEMQQPDFVATGELLTAWGTSPGYTDVCSF
ncbi:MAG: methyltransferase domain-containing protein, partial [Ktedonobacteraceae bacterium]|nr:methyltransferase domain-containing protein [Ktedonobacteraceae bacterium]